MKRRNVIVKPILYALIAAWFCFSIPVVFAYYNPDVVTDAVESETVETELPETETVAPETETEDPIESVVPEESSTPEITETEAITEPETEPVVETVPETEYVEPETDALIEWVPEVSVSSPDSATLYQPAEVSRENPWYFGLCKCTAYCSCPMCCDNFTTHSGTTVCEGRTVAVDPAYIPFGSHLIIDGVEYIAEDSGGAIKGQTIDIYFDTHEECINYGIQYHDVYIVSVGW